MSTSEQDSYKHTEPSEWAKNIAMACFNSGKLQFTNPDDDTLSVIGAARMIEEYAKSPSEWISVKDRLPETDDTNITHVLGWNGFEAVRVDFYREEGERFRTHCLKCFLEVTDQITHWMPLPEPPKV